MKENSDKGEWNNCCHTELAEVFNLMIISTVIEKILQTRKPIKIGRVVFETNFPT